MVRAHSPPLSLSFTADLRAEADRRWAPLAAVASPETPFEEVVAAHEEIRRVAEEVSGVTTSARQRALHYYSVYEASDGNFMFPLVATHGSLWGITHTLRLERVLARLRPLSRHGRIDRWVAALDAVRDVNRRVFVEIYSTFYFTRLYGTHPRAGEIIQPEVLALYNRVHDAVAAGERLSLEERREIYYTVFVHEQHEIVDPGVKEAAEAAGSRVLLEMLKRVSPRFRYFPRRERLYFTDFTSIDQRNREGLRALAFAEEVGPARVYEAMSEY